MIINKGNPFTNEKVALSYMKGVVFLEVDN